MEIKDVVEHKIIPTYEKKYHDCSTNPRETIDEVIKKYKSKVWFLEQLKRERDDVEITDYCFFSTYYFSLFNLYIRDVEGFSKFILGDEVNRLTIQQYEIEQYVKEFKGFDKIIFGKKNVYYEAFSNMLSVNSVINQSDIIRLERERKLFLFGKPTYEYLPDDTKIKPNSKYGETVYTIEEGWKDPNGLKFKNVDLSYFDLYYKDVVEKLRHSITDKEINKAKNTLREIDFQTLEYDFREKRDALFERAKGLEKFEEEARGLKSNKLLSKRP